MQFSIFISVPLILLNLAAQLLHCAISVLDENKAPIDWSIIYKLPMIPDHADPLLKKGLSYIYLLPGSNAWEKGKVALDQKSGHELANTLEQFYSNRYNKEVFHIFYNDQRPEDWGYVRGTGHAKGYAVFDAATGFWCIHSTPHFPYVDQFVWPSNGVYNGQTFLCMTLRTNRLPDIAKNLILSNVLVHSCNIPTFLAEQLDDLKQHCDKFLHPFFHHDTANATALERPKRKKRWDVKPLAKDDVKRMFTMNTFKREKITCFAKSSEFGKDIWSDLIAPQFKMNFIVQSWLHEETGPNFPSQCNTTYEIHNQLNFRPVDWVSIGNHHDHSKWGISEDSKAPVACIGDLNRQKGQLRRGGGFCCLQNDKVHRAFSHGLDKLEHCPTAPRGDNNNTSSPTSKADSSPTHDANNPQTPVDQQNGSSPPQHSEGPSELSGGTGHHQPNEPAQAQAPQTYVKDPSNFDYPYQVVNSGGAYNPYWAEGYNPGWNNMQHDSGGGAYPNNNNWFRGAGWKK